MAKTVHLWGSKQSVAPGSVSQRVTGAGIPQTAAGELVSGAVEHSTALSRGRSAAREARRASRGERERSAARDTEDASVETSSVGLDGRGGGMPAGPGQRA